MPSDLLGLMLNEAVLSENRVGSVVHVLATSRSPGHASSLAPPTGVASPSAFDLAAAKIKVAKAMEETAPGQFKRFFQSPLCDSLATLCTLYFVARFEHDTLTQVGSQ